MRTALPIALLAAGALLGAPAGADEDTPAVQQADAITLTIDGEYVQYSMDNKRAVLTGNVRILVCAPDYTGRRAVIHAERVDVDIEKGVISTDKGATLVVGPALFRGDDIRFDVPGEEFTIDGAQGYMALPLATARPQDPFPMAYLTGSRVGKRRDTIYILRGRITTCDKDDPHYSITAKRITYHVPSGHVKVYRAGLHLYGLNVPLLPWAKTSIGGTGSGKRFSLSTVPGYSSREGLYLPYSFNLTGPDNPWRAATDFRITGKRGITGSVWADRSGSDWGVGIRASRKVWAADDITDRLSLYRLPEVTFTRHLNGRDEPRHSLTFDISFGRFREDLESQPRGVPRRPRASEGRVLGALSYVRNAPDYKQHEGRWYGAKGRISAYTSGESYRDLELFAGAGGSLSDDISAHATLRHHVIDGTTPFLFDDVDIKTELEGAASWKATDKWGLGGWARWDIDRSALRDYEVTLTRRAHCLTWGLYYRAVGTRVGVRVDLTGLTGGTRPYAAKSSLQEEMQQEGLYLVPPEEGKGKINIRGDDCPPGAMEDTGIEQSDTKQDDEAEEVSE